MSNGVDELLEILAVQVGIIAAAAIMWYFNGYKNMPVLQDDVVEQVLHHFNNQPEPAAAYLAQEPLWPVLLMCAIPFQTFLGIYINCFYAFPVFCHSPLARDFIVPVILVTLPWLKASGGHVYYPKRPPSSASVGSSVPPDAAGAFPEADAAIQFLSSAFPEAAEVAQAFSSAFPEAASVLAQSLLSADPAMFEFHPLQWWIFCPSVYCAFCLLWKLVRLLRGQLH